eukprot:GHVN01024485.1.p1 GENE.GHVN01024485.1~~GHVN01024485.1.p1  ORF type:complete len:433 (+),score=131.78 GHVN01024485.1:67-1299(+)
MMLCAVNPSITLLTSLIPLLPRAHALALLPLAALLPDPTHISPSPSTPPPHLITTMINLLTIPPGACSHLTTPQLSSHDIVYCLVMSHTLSEVVDNLMNLWVSEINNNDLNNDNNNTNKYFIDFVLSLLSLFPPEAGVTIHYRNSPQALDQPNSPDSLNQPHSPQSPFVSVVPTQAYSKVMSKRSISAVDSLFDLSVISPHSLISQSSEVGVSCEGAVTCESACGSRLIPARETGTERQDDNGARVLDPSAIIDVLFQLASKDLPPPSPHSPQSTSLASPLPPPLPQLFGRVLVKSVRCLASERGVTTRIAAEIIPRLIDRQVYTSDGVTWRGVTMVLTLLWGVSEVRPLLIPVLVHRVPHEWLGDLLKQLKEAYPSSNDDITAYVNHLGAHNVSPYVAALIGVTEQRRW